MTTQPSDMKPSERYERMLAGHPYLSREQVFMRICLDLFDERHAAGHGEPYSDLRLPAEGSWVRFVATAALAECPRCKVLGIDRFTVDPIAAPPAQPVAAEPAVPVAGEPTCGGCGRAECTMLRRGDAGPALEDCRRYQYEHQRELRSEALDAALAQVEQLKGKLELCHEAHATMLANWSNEQRAHGETKRTLTAAQLSISEKKTI